MNTSKFTKISLTDFESAFAQQCHHNFVSCRKINNDCYAVEKNPLFTSYNTPLQNALFTLDNAKYWYLTFLYDFLFQCVDSQRIHFIEGDTDSIYFAVAGDLNDDIHQGFKHIVINQEFYDEHVYEWLPNPELDVADKKALLKVDIENEAWKMIALAPKCYYLYGETVKHKLVEKIKIKGVSANRNKQITGDSYYNCLFKNEEILGENCMFLTIKHNNYDISKVSVLKTALTKKNNKMVCLDNNSCAPFLEGVPLQNYFCAPLQNNNQ
jgi:hypothetical protein